MRHVNSGMDITSRMLEQLVVFYQPWEELWRELCWYSDMAVSDAAAVLASPSIRKDVASAPMSDHDFMRSVYVTTR